MELDLKIVCRHFPFWGAELSLFRFGGDEFSVFPSPNLPNPLSNFSWAYRELKAIHIFKAHRAGNRLSTVV